MNSKHSQSLIKASKSFSIHKVCFHDRGVIQISVFVSKWIEQFISTQCEYMSMCVCAPVWVCLCVIVSGFCRSWADLWLDTFSARHHRSSALLISTPPLVCNGSVHPQRAMKFLHRTDCLFYNLTQYGEEQERIAGSITRWCVQCLILKKKEGACCILWGCRYGFKSIQVSVGVSSNVCVCVCFRGGTHMKRDNIWVHVCQGRIIKCSLYKMYDDIWGKREGLLLCVLLVDTFSFWHSYSLHVCVYVCVWQINVCARSTHWSVYKM